MSLSLERRKISNGGGEEFHRLAIDERRFGWIERERETVRQTDRQTGSSGGST